MRAFFLIVLILLPLTALANTIPPGVVARAAQTRRTETPISNPSGIADGASINDEATEDVSSSNAVWRIAEQAWETECSDTLSAGSLGCDTYPDGLGTLRFGGYNSSIANLYGVGDKVFWEIDFMRPCGKDWEATAVIDGGAQYTGTMKFSRFATADNALPDSDAANNGGHLEVHENWGTPAENSTPAGATWGIYKENGVGGYTWTTTDAYPDCGTWNNYRMEIVLDTAIGANGDSRMQFFVNDTEVLDRTDTPTLTSANDEVEAGQFIIFYNGEVQTSESPLVGYFRNFEVSGTSAFFTHDPPGVPTSLVATAGDTEVDLTWTDAGGGGGTDEFVVEYRCDSDADASVTDELFVEHSRPATNSLTITGLTNDALCQFRVAAEDAVDDMSEFSTMDTATPVAAVAAAYRTIVVFGDTQQEMNNCSDGGGTLCNELSAQLTWVADNKAAENIDMVLFVGDLIDAGTVLSPAAQGATATVCDAEDWESDGTFRIEMASESTCRAEDEGGGGTGTPAACELIAGCFPYDDGTNPMDCLSCARAEVADGEWDAFQTNVVDRLISTGNVDVPFAAVGGNHDNSGKDRTNDTDREPLGYLNYDSTFWSGLEAGYGGTTVYDYLGTIAGTDALEKDAHAWMIPLQTTPAQDVLVVALPYGASATLESDVIDYLATYPATPSILLTHFAGEVRTPITNVSATVAPNIFLTLSGHVGTASGGNDMEITTNGSESVLDIAIDWTNSTRESDAAGTDSPTPGDFIGIVRIHDDGDIEAFAYSPGADGIDDGTATNSGGDTNRITKQAFDIMPPAAYDLSAYETQLARVFDDNGSARPAWPNPPALTGAPTTVITTDDCSTLQDAVATGGTLTGARKIELDAAVTNCELTFSESDVWLEMTDTASVTATSTTGTHNYTGTRVKITGGALIDGMLDDGGATGGCGSNLNGTDILIKNVNMTYCAMNDGDGGLEGVRIAIVGSDLTARGQCYLTGPDGVTDTFDHTDLIFANNDIDCATSSDNADYGFRLQDHARVLIVDNQIRQSDNNSPYRAIADSRYHLVVGNQFVSAVTMGAGWHQHYSEEGIHLGNLQHIYMLDNSYYHETASSVKGRVSYDSGFASCDSIVSEDNAFFQTGSLPNFYVGSSPNTACTNTVYSDPGTIGNTISAYSSTPAFTGGADH